MQLNFYEVVSFEDEDNGCMAETAIRVGGTVVGYIGGSRYTDTTRTEAEEVVRDALMELLGEKIKADPRVSEKSRFDYSDEMY